MQLHLWQKNERKLSLADAGKGKRVAVGYINNNDRVLDIGCGDCAFLDMIQETRKNCHLYGADIIPSALEICKKKGYTPVKNIKKLEGKFNVITLFECFEHLSYEQRIVYGKWIEDKLVDGGIVVLSFPYICSMLSLVHYYDNPEHKEPFPRESHLNVFFAKCAIKKRVYLSPWLNPIKIIHCVLTGLSMNAIHNNICFVLKKEK